MSIDRAELERALDAHRAAIETDLAVDEGYYLPEGKTRAQVRQAVVETRQAVIDIATRTAP